MLKDKTLETKDRDTLSSVDIDYKKLSINTKSGNFKRFYEAGLLNNIDETFTNSVEEYWDKYYSKKIDPTFHVAFKNFTGKSEPRLIPGREMWNEILPFFNDMNIRIGYSDKNMYDRLINPPSSTDNVLKRVRGHYFDTNNNLLTNSDAYNLLLIDKEDLIIKPSDTDNGTGIAKLKYKNQNVLLDDEVVTMKNLEDRYGYNFIVQKVIKQHPIMAAPHPASVNTLRMVTFRWKNEIRHLLTYARFGGDNNVKDHSISGGVSVGVTDSGELMNFAIDTNCKVYQEHPTTDYSFANNKSTIPNYEFFKSYVEDLHKNILHHDFVSWDIAVGIDGQPIFIESNFRGTSWRYQLVSQKPIFGDLTEEVLQYVSTELKKNKLKRNVKSIVPVIRSKNKDLKKDNKSLKIENRRLIRENKRVNKLNVKTRKQNNLIKSSLNIKENELRKANHEYQKVIQSRSWKSTLPLRKIGHVYRSLSKRDK